jgi:hypothetical protein
MDETRLKLVQLNNSGISFREAGRKSVYQSLTFGGVSGAAISDAITPLTFAFPCVRVSYWWDIHIAYFDFFDFEFLRLLPIRLICSNNAYAITRKSGGPLHFCVAQLSPRRVCTGQHLVMGAFR